MLLKCKTVRYATVLKQSYTSVSRPSVLKSDFSERAKSPATLTQSDLTNFCSLTCVISPVIAKQTTSVGGVSITGYVILIGACEPEGWG